MYDLLHEIKSMANQNVDTDKILVSETHTYMCSISGTAYFSVAKTEKIIQSSTEKNHSISLWISFGSSKITGLKFMNKISLFLTTTLFFSQQMIF